jgi:outer membrane protein TolC
MILELQLGMDVKDSIVLTDKLTDLYKNAKTPVVESVTDYTKRTEYQMLNQQIKLYNFEKKSYQLGYLPSLNAVAASQRNSFGSDFSKLGNIWYPGTYWGLNLSVPIFDGLRKSAKIQQTNINLQKAENDKKNLENGISQSIVAAKNGFELASKQVIILEENMKLAQEIYNQVEIKFKNGMSSSTNLVNAQTDLATARQNYLATIFDYFSNQIDLRRAVGDIK